MTRPASFSINAPQRRRPSGEFVLKGWHVLVILLSFFGVIIAMNILFITLAVQSFPGEDVKRSYVQGLEYNKTLDARARQTALGWQAEARFIRDAGAPALIVAFTDRTGAPVRGLSIDAALRRPTTDRQDIALAFTEVDPGLYRTDIATLGAGAWKLRGQAQGAGETFEFTGALSW
jgi:nitrogen fixation protein FixH